MEKKKTETEIRFKAYIKQGYHLLDQQRLDVGFGLQLMQMCDNLYIHFCQVKEARDNWRKKYEYLKASQDIKNGNKETTN